MIVCECHPLLQVSHRNLYTGLNSKGPGDSESNLDFIVLSWCRVLGDCTQLPCLFPPLGYYQATLKSELLKRVEPAEAGFAVFTCLPCLTEHMWPGCACHLLCALWLAAIPPGPHQSTGFLLGYHCVAKMLQQSQCSLSFHSGVLAS